MPGRVDVAGYSPAVWNAAVPAALRYDPTTNPVGARPTVYDENANVFGKDPATGFALRTFDNVGVQYGLAALNAGLITKQQFLDLNERIGGYDHDENYVATRSVGNAGAIRRAYQAGLNLGGGGGLSEIPVFDFTGIYSEDTTNYHLQWEHFATRERMREANGGTGNHVMWRAVPATLALDAPARVVFDEWMEAYKADHSRLQQRDRVIRNRPSAAVDGCFVDAKTFVAEEQTFSRNPDSTCNKLMPSYAFPRYVAGGPLAANKLKCQLKAIDPGDYAVSFTAAELARLGAIFPDGVCDWSRRGVEHVGVLPWPSSPATGVIGLAPCYSGTGEEIEEARCTPPVTLSVDPGAPAHGGSEAWVTATVRAAPGFSLSRWSLRDVRLNGVPAADVHLGADGSAFHAMFDRSKLPASAGKAPTLFTITGRMAARGNEGRFVATDMARLQGDH